MSRNLGPECSIPWYATSRDPSGKQPTGQAWSTRPYGAARLIASTFVLDKRLRESISPDKESIFLTFGDKIFLVKAVYKDYSDDNTS